MGTGRSYARRHWIVLLLASGACSDDGSSPNNTTLTAVGVRVGFGIICARDGATATWSCGGTGFPGITPAGLFRLDSLGQPDPSLVPLTTPVPLADVQLGPYGACGLDAQGMAWCWGQNLGGVLGTGSTADVVEVPEPVQGGHRFRSLAMSPLPDRPAACGIDEGGTAWCWGKNVAGQLGVGDALDRTVPTPVSGLPLAAAIMAPQRTTCALEAAGPIWCWGDNGWRQATPGSATSIFYSPSIAVPDLRFTTVVNSWQSGCGVAAGGALWCWGQMGLPAGASGPLRRVAVDTIFTELASNGLMMFGRTAEGDVYYWGELESDGFEGTPTRLPFPTPLSSLAAGRFPADGAALHGACGIGTDAQVYCAAPSWNTPSVWRLTRGGVVPVSP
jgi:hypothetical protein